MLNADKLRNAIKKANIGVGELAGQLARSGLDAKTAVCAIKNWQKGLMKPKPRAADITQLARALGVEENAISQWKATIKYAPMSSRKARLVTQLIAGRGVQEAMDILKFTNKRAASMVNKALKSAVANADENAADVENLYVSEARADSAGIRIGTKRWIAKDRGRAHAIHKMGSHLHITVSEH